MRLRETKGLFACLLMLYVLCLPTNWHNALLQSANVTKQYEDIRKISVPVAGNSTAAKLKTDEQDQIIAEKFQKRVSTMKKHCPHWHKSPLRKSWIVNRHFLIHYNRRILACAVPKAGSTSWHVMIWALRRREAGLSADVRLYSDEDTLYNGAIPSNLTFKQGSELIFYREGDDDMLREPPTHKSKRVILSRHPFARLISGWHQKFLHGSAYADLMFTRYPTLRDYVRLTDPNHHIAWKDFAEFIADQGQDIAKLDYHYKPISYLCKPCEYAYSYVVKSETIDRDQEWLLRRLNVTDIGLGRNGTPPGGSLLSESPSDKIKLYMSQLTGDTIISLFKVYKNDFKIFGYTFDFKTLESGGFI